MADGNSQSCKVAIVWRGDAQARREATPATSRQRAVFEALARHGVAAEACVYAEDTIDEVRAQLLRMDGVLVWVDPISGGQRRDMLDEVLREVSAAGVVVSAHPDVILKMGVKEVLYRTRDLGWGADTQLYETRDAFETEFPARLEASGARVLKQNRGNGGIGVWKVEFLDAGMARVQEARGEAEPRILPLRAFLYECRAYFDGGGKLIDQAFQPRLPEGMIRCYMSEDLVVGFGRQIIRGLMPADAGPPGPRIMSGPGHPPFQALRARMEGDWTPAMARLLEIEALPVIWDADFLYGPKDAAGEDTYVLCEINVSSVFPIPDEAPEELARAMARRVGSKPERAADSRTQTR
ncbi:Cj0069 family protein [Phenylobacterium sp.]|uniref:Cj0069 family protein n=1 Tax=Phenylobacterium sp. TaxID=1871053 RepID=UPI002733304B|nr:Cj0069 family protein [Phenylobacterium sp.]MDP3854802.1 Cj0069 family protein [Phenylobacterium sp.]